MHKEQYVVSKIEHKKDNLFLAKKHHLGLRKEPESTKAVEKWVERSAFAYVRWWEGWDSSDMEFSGERASGGTKQDRKASRKEIPRPPPSDDAVVATEKRDSSPLPPGSLLRLPAEPVPLTLLIMA